MSELKEPLKGIHFFVIQVMAPLILLIGFVGNTFGFFVLLRKKTKKIGPIFIYRCLMLMDMFYLLQIIIDYLGHAFESMYNLTTVSSLACKLYIYFNYSLAPISPQILVYILIERVVSLKWPSERFFLRKPHTQAVYFFVIALFNLIYYIPVPVFYDVKFANSSDSIVNAACAFTDPVAQTILSWMDLGNRILVPYIIMTACSLLLIFSITKMRTRVVQIFLAQVPNTTERRKNVRFVATTILLNTIFILLNMPFAVVCFLPDYYYDLAFLFTFYLYYMSYALSFYIMLASNSLFRKEFLIMIRLRNQEDAQTLNH